MKAVVLRGADAIAFEEHPEPTGASGNVVVEVLAAGLNPVDLSRMLEAQLPSIPGNEGVGRLVSGERVYFERTVAPFGSFAQRAVVESARPIAIPQALGDGPALSLGIAGLAGWLSVERTGALAPGESVLVLGASGAVGHVAVQAARLLGARRIVAAARNVNAITAPGADETVELSGDYGAALADAAGSGFDLVIDPLYGEPLVAALAACAPGARIVSGGASAGATATIPRSLLYGRSLLSHGNRTIAIAAQARRLRGDGRARCRGRLSCRSAHEVIPMERFADAFERQRAHPHAKLILVPPEPGP